MKHQIFVLIVFLMLSSAKAEPPFSIIDTLILGNAPSEKAHGFNDLYSEKTTNGLGESARRLLPPAPDASNNWDGGRIAFKMKVDPKEQNYLTARFWGGERGDDMLIVFCEGKQLGYRHNGDVDLIGKADEEPRYPGRFYYSTTPLPRRITEGKTELKIEIRASGPIWAYGSTFDQYQKPMTKPSRAIYKIYTHTNSCFTPPVEDKQGEIPILSVRSGPGPEILDRVKERVNLELSNILKSSKPVDQMRLQFLAMSYHVKWTDAYHQKSAVEQIVKGVDGYYERFKNDPRSVWNDRATYNPGWVGVGPAADAVRLTAAQLKPVLDERLPDGRIRRAAWSEMFKASFKRLRHDRKWLSNQAMFSDVNIYRSNKALEDIDPTNAVSEANALHYLYESVGLLPWLGADTGNGSTKIFGTNFYQVTEKGITRELGFSGDYGEGGAEGAMEIYDATREPGGEGDVKIKAQLAKMYRARGVFRYPASDSEGNRAMRLETVVGWRDFHYPGRVVYVQRSNNPLAPVAATLDPYLVGWSQQMFADNQFFANIADNLTDNHFRVTAGLLGLPDDYAVVKAQPVSGHQLPMSWNEPDSVWSDETDGVVAIKNGEEILYASLFWRANFGINCLARTHFITPRYQKVADVCEEVQFTPSGRIYRRPDWINFGFGNGGTQMRYPADIHQALAGEELPIAQAPPEVTTPSHFVGRGDFYTLRYGNYLISMNMTTDKTFELRLPTDTRNVKDLVSGKKVILDGPIKVTPHSTAVLWFEDRLYQNPK